MTTGTTTTGRVRHFDWKGLLSIVIAAFIVIGIPLYAVFGISSPVLTPQGPQGQGGAAVTADEAESTPTPEPTEPTSKSSITGTGVVSVTTTPTPEPTPEVTPTETSEVLPPPLPKITVEWEPYDGEIEIPKEDEGFYSGTIWSNVGVLGAHPTDEGREYVNNILVNPTKQEPVFLAISKASNNPEIVFAGATIWCHSGILEAYKRGEDTSDMMIPILNYLILSLDGEKSWIEINLCPNLHPDPEAQFVIEQVRVMTDNSSLLLFVNIGQGWWQTLLPLETASLY